MNMEALESAMRDEVRKLFDNDKVDLVIGYQKGTMSFRTAPAFITKKEDVDKLVWNACCANNLVNYLMKPEHKGKRVGIIVKGCDARSLLVCINEGQFERDKVIIIGMPCSGIFNRKAIEAKVAPREITEMKVEDDIITLKGLDFTGSLPKKEYIQTSCQTCIVNNPPMCDILIGGEPVELTPSGEWEEMLKVFDARTADEKWEYFTDLLKDCIRCYACRNACPLCYCPECFVDQIQPQWVGKTNHMSDVMFYHLIRAFHVAGRCTNCGGCTRACPMGIDLRLLSKKLEKIVKDRYGATAGMDTETPPAMGTHTLEDPEEFITEPE